MLRQGLAVLTVVGALGASPALAQVDFQGTLTRHGQEVGTVTGTIEDIVFRRQGNEIVAVGQLTGELIDAAGNTIGSISRQVQLAIADIGTAEPTPANCQVLFLDLGPIDLKLLGVELHVDDIVIDLEANPAGGILGELLCALGDGLGLDLGGLIDDLLGGLLSNAEVAAIVGILNSILGGL